MDGKYEISVITPFHNVDMKYFREAVQSMLAQTIGFEKIQWLVIVHNCEPQFMPELEKMLGQYPNVVLRELRNDQKTPSSPRNLGVELATAPYIGYLDGDDSYHPTCLEECVRNAKETEAQIVNFRRDHELEDDSLMPIPEIVMWNQLESRIVIDRAHWDMKRMFGGIWTFVTSKIFDRSFLLRNGIMFDESVPYCEDCLYSITAIAKAERICYLPQLIGYHYYINGGSLVQKLSKDGAALVEYAKGMAKVIKTGYDFGIDVNQLGQLIVSMQCGFMLNSDLTKEQREAIKCALGPYVYRFTPLAVDKYINKETSNYFYALAHEVILNAEDFDRNENLQELRSGSLTLQKILDENEKSDFGEKYHFQTLRSIPAYQFSVPLSRLAGYQKLINIQAKIGETGILTSNKVEGYIRSGDGMVPYTRDSIAPYVTAMAATLKGHHNLWVAQCELTGRMLNDRKRLQSLGSVIVRDYFFECVYGGGVRPATFSMPDGVFFSETNEENDYGTILHHALLDRGIDQIVATDATKIARVFRLLEDERDAVIGRLKAADPVRAAEVLRALGGVDAGKGGAFAKTLWPNLARVVACGTGSHAANREYLRRFVGPVAWNNGYVFLPEMVLGHATGDEVGTYRFDGTGCFCEFFRNDTDDIGKPVTMSKLEPGHTYNVIVTNNAGLYRVVTDAEIRVVENGAGGLIVEVTQ